MMTKPTTALFCLCACLAWAEEPTGAIPGWQAALERETAAAEQTSPPGRLREACAAAAAAAERLRQAQLDFGQECIYLYADYYRPELDVVDNMLAAFTKQVDECLMQDLRTVISLSPWCRQGDRGGFWLRKPSDAALWLTDIPMAQPRPLPGLFFGRNRAAAATTAKAGETAFALHRHIVELCAQEIAGMYTADMPFEPLAGTEPRGGDIPPEDILRAQEAFLRAEQAWNEYFEAVSRVISGGEAPAGAYIRSVQSRLLATHMQYFAFISNGVQAGLNLPPQYGDFHVDTGQQRHPFGEIFHDYAMFFRHPALPGNPWCMTMSGPSSAEAAFTYVAVPPCPELEAYEAAHPEGGLVFVHGYFDVEVTGRPYEPVNRPAGEDGKIPDPRPADAYRIRTVLRVISLMPLKW